MLDRLERIIPAPAPLGMTSTAGLLAAIPLPATVVPGSRYFATDDDGGTLYEQIGGAWQAVAPGLLETAGVELARTELVASPALKGDAGLVDVPGLSVNFATGARPARLELVCPQASSSAANSGGRVAIIGPAGLLEDAAGDGGAANTLFQLRVQTRIPAGQALGNYRVQYANRTGGNFLLGASAVRKIKLYAVTC